jgi:hypothetical protein
VHDAVRDIQHGCLGLGDPPADRHHERLHHGLTARIGAVAIDAAQIKGVLPLPLSSLRATLPVFKNPANRHRSVALTAEQFRYSFGNAVSEQESDELHGRWTVPSPGRPLFEAAVANFSQHSPAEVDTRNEDRGPLLLVMGGFPDRGHSLTVDSGWRQVADGCLEWLAKQGLGAGS